MCRASGWVPPSPTSVPETPVARRSVNNQIAGVFSFGADYYTPTNINPDLDQRVDSTFGEVAVMNQVANPAAKNWINATLATDNTGPYDLVLDMSRQAFGADGVADPLNINVTTSATGVLTITVTDLAHPYSRYNGVYAQVNAAQVHDLVIKGTDDHETVTVSGGLPIAGKFTFQGGGGNDSLTLNLGGPANSVTLPPGGIVFDGGNGSNSLIVNDTSALPGGTLKRSQLSLTHVDTWSLTGSANFTVDQNATIENVTLSQNGVLNLTSLLTVGTSFVWGDGGTIKGTADLTAATQALVTVVGSGEKRLQGVRWVNLGVVRVTGTGNLALNNGASIQNLGTFDLQAGANLSPDESAGDPGTEQFVNSGLLLKSGGQGIANFGRNGNAHLALVNLNQVQVQSGTLRLSGDASGAGSIDISGGTLELSLGYYDFPSGALVTGSGTLSGVGGDTTTIEGAVSMLGQVNFAAGTFNVAAGGRIAAANGILIGPNATLTGDGILVGTVTNTGHINPGAVGGLGTLTIQGDYIQNGSAVLWAEIGQGNVSDLLNVTGAATINGGQLYALALDPLHFRPASGTTFTILMAKSVTARVNQVVAPGVGPAPSTEPPVDITVAIGSSVTITYLERKR